MTPEQKALELYPVKYKRDTDRKHPDLNKPLREAWLDGYETGYNTGFDCGWDEALCWHPASEHPAIDEEVIVLTDALGVAPYYEIAVGHIVNIDCVDFNGWNIRGVVWWMPMPKIPNEK